MASVLSSLGITESTPDPAAYQNQKEVAAQTDEARGEVKSTLDSVNLAVSTADLLGLPTDSLKSIQTQANDLYNSTNLSPAEMERKRKALDASLAAEQTAQAAAKKTKLLENWTALGDNMTNRIKQIRADKTTSPGLVAKYTTLEQTITTAANAARAANKEGKAIPETPTPDSLQDELEALDSQKEQEEAKAAGLLRASAEAKKMGLLAFLLISVSFAALLGGIITSNVFAEEVFWGIKLYYFVYGAAFFPIALLYGMFRPPTWQATIFPWSIREGLEATTLMERLFSYHIYTAEEIEADEAGEGKLAGGRKSLRSLSILMTVFSIIAGYLFGVADYVKQGELNTNNSKFTRYGYRAGRLI